MPKITMQKIKTDALKELLGRTGLARQELATKLGLKTPSVFFKWMKNGEMPADKFSSLHQLIQGASGSANPAATKLSAIRLQGASTNADLAHVPERALVGELQRRGWDVTLKPIGGVVLGEKGQ